MVLPAHRGHILPEHLQAGRYLLVCQGILTVLIFYDLQYLFFHARTLPYNHTAYANVYYHTIFSYDLPHGNPTGTTPIHPHPFLQYSALNWKPLTQCRARHSSKNSTQYCSRCTSPSFSMGKWPAPFNSFISLLQFSRSKNSLLKLASVHLSFSG